MSGISMSQSGGSQINFQCFNFLANIVYKIDTVPKLTIHIQSVQLSTNLQKGIIFIIIWKRKRDASHRGLKLYCVFYQSTMGWFLYPENLNVSLLCSFSQTYMVGTGVIFFVCLCMMSTHEARIQGGRAIAVHLLLLAPRSLSMILFRIAFYCYFHNLEFIDNTTPVWLKPMFSYMLLSSSPKRENPKL